MTHQKEIADRIAQLRREKSARERRDVLQEEIAKAVGVSVVSYGRYENGRRKVPEEVIQRLADYFGTTAPFIRYGVEGIAPTSGTLTEEERLAAIARSTARRAAQGLPSVAEEEAAKKQTPGGGARAAGGGPRHPKPPTDER